MWTRDLFKNERQAGASQQLLDGAARRLRGFPARRGSSNIGPTLTFNYTTGSDHYNYQYGYDRAVLPYFGAVAAAAFGFVLIAMVVGVLFSVFVSNPGDSRQSAAILWRAGWATPVLVAVLRVRRPSLPQRGESDVYENLFIFLWSLLFVIPRHL